MRYLLLCSIVACTMSEQAFQSRVGATACERFETCAPGIFDALYEDTAACRDDLERTAKPFDHCVYNASEARDCLDAIRDLTCTDVSRINIFPRDCFTVYDCDDVNEDDAPG